jgi:hypothetical protein
MSDEHAIQDAFRATMVNSSSRRTTCPSQHERETTMLALMVMGAVFAAVLLDALLYVFVEEEA